MNRIMTSLLMIGVVAAMAGAGMFAYCIDTETSTGQSVEERRFINTQMERR